MYRYLSIMMGGLVWVATTPAANAQMVRVGPFGGVSVRVPFFGVGVDVLPFGQGTRVRAPFTSVNTGVYRAGYRSLPYAPYDVVPVYPAPIYSAPVYPGSVPSYEYPLPYDQVAPGPYAHAYDPPIVPSSVGIKESLRASAERLARSLAQRRDDSDVWLNYLRPDQIIAVIDGDGSPESLNDLLMNYEGVTGNSQLSEIWIVDGFRQTHQRLAQYLQQAGVDGGSEGAEVSPMPEPDENVDEPMPANPIQPAGDESDFEELPPPTASL